MIKDIYPEFSVVDNVYRVVSNNLDVSLYLDNFTVSLYYSIMWQLADKLAIS